MKCLSWNRKESGLTDFGGDMLECEMFYLMALLVVKRKSCRKQMDKDVYTTEVG